MTYEEALRFLAGRQETRWKLGLERIESLLERMGRPQDAVPAVHIAGTNGKGAFCALLSSVLEEAGMRTGLYTSPHLVAPTERIRLGGRDIAPEDFGRTIAACRDAESEPASYFELLTASAFLHFRERKADAAVLEVGLGGRLDATNVVRKPLLTVITSIDFDHMVHLGGSLASIAREKAGILKPGIPCLAGECGAEALASIRARADEVGAAVHLRSRPLEIVSVHWEDGAQELALPDGRRMCLRLLGSAAARNASLVMDAVSMLRERGIEIPEDAVSRGVARVRWPGRFQVLSERGRPLILDGAHNMAAMRAFVRTWEESPWSGRGAVFILGMLRDKDHLGMIRLLAPHLGRVIVTRPDSHRAIPPGRLARAVREAGCADVTEAGDARSALDAWLRTAPAGTPGVVAGSLYLVGNVLSAMREVAA